jgi:iron complex transport system substrate-binding protein
MVGHDAGETEICGQPQKVAALSPRSLDIMLSLGIQPAGYSEANLLNPGLHSFDNPSKQIPYLGEQITTQPVNLGDRNNPSLEKLVLLKPDLILVVGHGSDLYEQLSKIAPTLLLRNGVGRKHWQHRLQVLAQVFGREEQAEQVIARHEQQLAEAQAKLEPVLAVYPQVLVISTYQGLGNIYILSSYNSSNSPYESDSCVLLEAIGFQLVLPEKSLQPTQVSLEVLSQLDPDIIIVQVWNPNNAYSSQDTIQRQWKQSPLLQNMRASREERLYFVDSVLWGSNIGGPITDELILERLPKLLFTTLEEK